MKRYFLLSAFAFCSLALSAQETQEITLNEAIALARTQSVDAAVALNELKTAYWEYRTFRADLLPEVNFSGTLPSYSKQYNSYQNEDGSYSFVRSNKLGLNGALSIDQNIWFTGGKVSLSSSLDFMKQLGSGGSRQFMSVPIALQLTQPIFGVNNLKWNRRIEPVRYEEAKSRFYYCDGDGDHECDHLLLQFAVGKGDTGHCPTESGECRPFVRGGRG